MSQPIIKEKISVVRKGEVYLYRVSRRETEGTELMKTRLGWFLARIFWIIEKKDLSLFP